ncbi:T9SS type A sorting domain-containing protein [Tamlana fucoidanivorans]|nr:T9SS type A sorting domain-containing protein [Tamlana fucoidanivorans]
MKKILLFLYTFSSLCFSQQIYISNSASITLHNGSSLNAFGLEISPNSTFVITDNILTISDSQVTVSEAKTSIARVYNMEKSLNGFNGMISLNYQDSEINGGDEANLNIEVLANNIWTKYEPSIVNQVLNNVSYDGIFNNLNMDKVTASAPGITLNMNDEKIVDDLVIYPNPASSFINIKSNKTLLIQIYNLQGKLLFENNLKVIDLSNLFSGTYIIKTTDSNSNYSNTYKC